MAAGAAGETEESKGTRPPRKRAPAAPLSRNFVIFDVARGQPYVPVSWPSLSLATQACDDLLVPYARGHMWRGRLKAREWHRQLPRSKG